MSKLPKLSKKAHAAVEVVWNNGEDKRYQPRSYNGGTGWGVWDEVDGCFVDDKLEKIDPSEPLKSTRH